MLMQQIYSKFSELWGIRMSVLKLRILSHLSEHCENKKKNLLFEKRLGISLSPKFQFSNKNIHIFRCNKIHVSNNRLDDKCPAKIRSK